MMLSIFPCTYWSFVYLLWRKVYSSYFKKLSCLPFSCWVAVPFSFLIVFRERKRRKGGGGREEERDIDVKHRLVAYHMRPYQGSNARRGTCPDREPTHHLSVYRMMLQPSHIARVNCSSLYIVATRFLWVVWFAHICSHSIGVFLTFLIMCLTEKVYYSD